MLKFYFNNKEIKELENYSKNKIYGLNRLLSKNILISSGDKEKEIFAVSDEVLSIFKKMKCLPYSIGNLIAEKKGKKYNFSLWAIEKLSKFNPYIIVDEKGEQTFLYGYNLISKMVIKTSKKFKNNEYLFVKNRLGDTLGIGLWVGGLNKEGIVVKNLKNISKYLNDKC